MIMQAALLGSTLACVLTDHSGAAFFFGVMFLLSTAGGPNA
jgi:hypothetical protein